jgi:hypothetical protein
LNTYLVKKSKKLVCKVKAPSKLYAVVLAWEKVFRIANCEDVMNKFGADKTFLFAELKLGSAGYYLDKEAA